MRTYGPGLKVISLLAHLGTFRFQHVQTDDNHVVTDKRTAYTHT